MANLQPVYGEYLAPAIAGMRANMEPARVISRINGSGLTVGMGVAVTRGSTDMTVQTPVQGGKYLGVTGLDPTVRPTFVDKYATNDIMAIYTKGVLWVTATASVTPGQAAYYDGVGNFTNVTGAGFGSGRIDFTANPTASSTIVLNGTTATFVASGATGTQVNIGTTLSASMLALLSMLQGSSDTQLVKFTYALANNNTTLVLTAATSGTGGNALTYTTTVPGATAGAGTLLGGTSANTAIPNAEFDSTAAPGGLVKLRLS
jgi:hypothetical protein